jgi:hypothetical protein
VRVDQHDLPDRPARKRPRLLVHRIAERLDRALHALAGFGANVGAVVEHARDRDPGDPGGPGDIVDCRVALHRARRVASVLKGCNG